MAIEYPVVLRPLSAEEGGGYLAEVYDLPGCSADGDNEFEALEAVADAIAGWIKTAQELGRPVPEPSRWPSYSGRFVQRVPKHLHANLARRAKLEGVSMNTLVTTMLASAIGEADVSVPGFQVRMDTMKG